MFRRISGAVVDGAHEVVTVHQQIFSSEASPHRTAYLWSPGKLNVMRKVCDRITVRPFLLPWIALFIVCVILGELYEIFRLERVQAI